MKLNNILAFAFLFSAFLFGTAQITFAQNKQNDLKFKAEMDKDCYSVYLLSLFAFTNSISG